MIMTTKLMPHWIPTHPDRRDGEWLSQWQPTFTKIVFVSDDQIPQLDVALKHSTYVIARHHPVSENWESRGFRDAAHARETAQGHAAYLGRLWNEVRKRYPDVPPERIVWEGLNEPHEWSDEPAALTAIYYAEFVQRMAVQGLQTVALNIGVGWPGNGGVTDAPPIWQPYEPIIAALDRYGGFLGLHEYWGPTGPQPMWRWHAGRYTQCPYRVPILITECGVDAAVVQAGQYYGYRGLSPDGNVAARMFIEHLTWYDARLHEDPRVQGAMIYTYDFSAGWATFDYRNQEFMTPFLGYVRSQPQHDHGQIVPPTPPVKDPIRVLMPDGSVRVLALEEYLRGVVPAEMPAAWPMDALRAQAVWARSYALWRIANPRHASFDLYGTTNDQVWNPQMRNSRSDIAVRETEGIWLEQDGKTFAARYVARCGRPDCPDCQGAGGTNNETWHVRACQYGARAMANAGRMWREIAVAYYGCQGVRLSDEQPTQPDGDGGSMKIYDVLGNEKSPQWLATEWGVEVDTSLRHAGGGDNFECIELREVEGAAVYRVRVLDRDGQPWSGRFVARYYPGAPNSWPGGSKPDNIPAPPEAATRVVFGQTNTAGVCEFGLGGGDYAGPGQGVSAVWLAEHYAGTDVVRKLGMKPNTNHRTLSPTFRFVPGGITPQPQPGGSGCLVAVLEALLRAVKGA